MKRLLFIFIVFFNTVLAITPETVINNACHDIWVSFDSKKIDTYYSSDFLGHEGCDTFDQKDLIKYLHSYEKKYKNASCTIDEFIVDGERIAARMTYKATIKKSNQEVIYHGLILFHLKNNKISEAWLAFEPALD